MEVRAYGDDDIASGLLKLFMLVLPVLILPPFITKMLEDGVTIDDFDILGGNVRETESPTVEMSEVHVSRLVNGTFVNEKYVISQDELTKLKRGDTSSFEGLITWLYVGETPVDPYNWDDAPNFGRGVMKIE